MLLVVKCTVHPLIEEDFHRDQLKLGKMQAPAEPPAPPAPQNPPAPKDPPAPQGLDGLSQMLAAEFAKLNDAIVKANLQQAQQPPQESVDDILASIINPPQKQSGTPYSIKEVKTNGK